MKIEKVFSILRISSKIDDRRFLTLILTKLCRFIEQPKTTNMDISLTGVNHVQEMKFLQLHRYLKLQSIVTLVNFSCNFKETKSQDSYKDRQTYQFHALEKNEIILFKKKKGNTSFIFGCFPQTCITQKKKKRLSKNSSTTTSPEK